MNKKDPDPKIPEYKPKEVENIDYEDWNYLEMKFNFNKDRFKPKIYDTKTKKGTKTIIENTSYAGIIQLKNIRLYFSTKVNAHLFYMLNFLRPENEKDERRKNFIFDPDKLIEMEEGFNFYDVIGRLLSNELENINEVGLFKMFIRQHDNRTSLKGKLDIKGQIDNEICNRLKFSCKYNDLTLNNRLNQIVLKATNNIIPMVKYNKNVIKDLKYYEYTMKEYIELANITSDDCDYIHFNELNDYYSEIIKLSKVILNESFIKSYYKGGSIGFNFIINMNKACQDFFEAMTKNVIKKYFPELVAIPQEKIRSVIIGSREKPDLILKDEHTKSIRLVFEFKYKPKDMSVDHRQATIYGLAVPEREACCLLYPMSDKDIEEIKFFLTDITKSRGNVTKVPIYIRTVDLYMEKNLGYHEFIENIETQIKNIIDELLNIQEGQEDRR